MRRLCWLGLFSILLMIGLAGCDPKVIEPVKDPFVLGENTITKININMSVEVYSNDKAPMTSEVFQMSSWVKTTQTIMDPDQLKMEFKDDQGYVYRIYRQSGKYLAVISHADYTTVHRYWISAEIMTQWMTYLSENYLSDKLSALDFVKAYWGTDESTLFDIDPLVIRLITEPRDIQVATEPIDLTRRHAEFSLIDEIGNQYHFYGQAYAVKIIWAKDQSSEIYTFDISRAHQIYQALITNYVEKTVVNQLDPVILTHVYLKDVSSFSVSKMVSIDPKINTDIQKELRLDRAYQADLLPDAQSECKFTFKGDNGLYYVVCYNPHVVGVGPDLKGTLTYYSFGDFNDTDLGGYMVGFPLPAPSGSLLDDLTFTRVTAVQHCECDTHVDLSLAQSNYLNDLMDLSTHTKVILNHNYFSDYYDGDLFWLTASNGRRFDFVIYPKTKTIMFTTVYPSNGEYGTTYYQIDGAGYEKVLEAHFYLSGLLDPNKADANPTFTGFYIGNVLSGNTAIIDLPMTTLTSAQITTIDGLLQRSKWQELSIYDEPIPLDSSFVLQKSSDVFYIFSKVGSIATVTEQPFNGWGKVYLIPISAFNDVLNQLKTY